MTLKNIILDEYSVYTADGKKYTITQNALSLSLFFKSLVYTNSGVLFFCSLINCFQNLKTVDETDTPFYFRSHSITLYCLRMLAKYGLIEIETCNRSKTSSLTWHYKSIGNEERKTELKMYEVTFRKIRSLTTRDEEMIRKMGRILKIPESDIILEDTNGTLCAKLNPRIGLRNILNGEARKRLIRQYGVLFGEDGIIKEVLEIESQLNIPKNKSK